VQAHSVAAAVRQWREWTPGILVVRFDGTKDMKIGKISENVPAIDTCHILEQGLLPAVIT
jgi:hypothetical protein